MSGDLAIVTEPPYYSETMRLSLRNAGVGLGLGPCRSESEVLTQASDNVGDLFQKSYRESSRMQVHSRVGTYERL